MKREALRDVIARQRCHSQLVIALLLRRTRRYVGLWHPKLITRNPLISSRGESGAGNRDLAPRAPYFHNGIAATLADVVTFYERSLGFDFSSEEEADLAAFLGAL